MEPLLTIPRPVAPLRLRRPKDTIPQTKPERERLAQFIRGFVKEWAPVPPLPANDLRQLADKVLELTGVAPVYREYVAILINNEVWRETLAARPSIRGAVAADYEQLLWRFLAAKQSHLAGLMSDRGVSSATVNGTVATQGANRG